VFENFINLNFFRTKVSGEYSLKEADGTWRRVTYVADHTGFHAQVIANLNPGTFHK
jgi:hypothetical protein